MICWVVRLYSNLWIIRSINFHLTWYDTLYIIFGQTTPMSSSCIACLGRQNSLNRRWRRNIIFPFGLWANYRLVKANAIRIYPLKFSKRDIGSVEVLLVLYFTRITLFQCQRKWKVLWMTLMLFVVSNMSERQQTSFQNHTRCYKYWWEMMSLGMLIYRLGCGIKVCRGTIMDTSFCSNDYQSPRNVWR